MAHTKCTHKSSQHSQTQLSLKLLCSIPGTDPHVYSTISTSHLHLNSESISGAGSALVNQRSWTKCAIQLVFRSSPHHHSNPTFQRLTHIYQWVKNRWRLYSGRHRNRSKNWVELLRRRDWGCIRELCRLVQRGMKGRRGQQGGERRLEKFSSSTCYGRGSHSNHRYIPL